MAENAANFTRIYEIKPSILEVIAQNSLNETLYPAFERTSQFLADSFPHKFGWLNLFNAETFVVIKGVLDYHYLKHYDSSFSENFYGLKRILGNGEKLNEHHKHISLIFIVILPYVRRKLKEKHEIVRMEHAERLIQKNLSGYCKLLFLYAHSTIDTLWSVFSVFHFIKYMANQTDFQTPALRIQNIKLTHDLEPQDSMSIWKVFSSADKGISRILMHITRCSLITTFEIGAFFLQFIKSWNVKNINYDVRDLPQVPPPLLDNKSRNVQSKCPICLKFWVTPTVLQVSGYIFCFRCILKYLNEHHKCPVTNLPARPLDIVRLYTS